MVLQNLYFFDKFGKNLNLEYDTTTDIWKGTIFFEPTSINLFDNQNIFILEKVGADYKFPVLYPNEEFKFIWKNRLLENQYFLYDVIKDTSLKQNYINKVDEKRVAFTDLDSTNSLSEIDLKIPLQINIGFSPDSESRFEQDLFIYFNNVLIAQIGFYGEGTDEEERFRVWTQNFGIKFLKEDANLLKDYDIKEALPDYNQLNKIRKELLVNKDEIYPYIGTYRGLINFINILGYKDTLKVKEYWKNINTKSQYFEKMSLVDITDYLDDGVIDTLDLVDTNKNLKSGRQFQKTEFLALTYEFTQVTGEYDFDGIPLTRETTDFTVNEIFYKLNGLGSKVKSEFLPINVKIKDIIGEFIYFQKISILFWKDDTHIWDYSLNDEVNFNLYPTSESHLVLRSLSTLFRQSNPTGLDITSLNSSYRNPFEDSQKWNPNDIEGIVNYIKSFYTEIKNQRFPDINSHLSWDYGDDPERILGAPIIVTLDTNKFKIEDLDGVELSSLLPSNPSIAPYWTLANIDFKNYYEVNWKIVSVSNQPYQFEYRGKVSELHTLPHILPYSGKYRIIAELTDFYGHVSVFSKFVTVDSDLTPEIIAYTRLEDKFDYNIKNLSNIQLSDFGSSKLYYPHVTVLDNEDSVININLYKNLIEWVSLYKTRYGIGQNLYDVEIYDEVDSTYKSYFDPYLIHSKKNNWGLGKGEFPIKLSDFNSITLDSLYWLRLGNLIFTDDFNAGFYIESPIAGDILKISDFSDFTIPTFIDIDNLVTQLNTSIHPGISLFNYSNINNKIHAQANYLGKENYHMLSVLSGTTQIDKYSYFTPKGSFSKNLIDTLTLNYPNFNSENLFLLAKTSSVLNDQVSDPQYWIDSKYWNFIDDTQTGFLPSIIDENSFNLDTIKIFRDTFILPENGICFFVINNLDGKSDFEWILTDTVTSTEIIKVKSVPFFVWKFTDIGTYSISCKVTDNRKTIYENSVKNFIQVLDKTTYTRNIENRLNVRKNHLIDNSI